MGHGGLLPTYSQGRKALPAKAVSVQARWAQIPDIPEPRVVATSSAVPIDIDRSGSLAPGTADKKRLERSVCQHVSLSAGFPQYAAGFRSGAQMHFMTETQRHGHGGGRQTPTGRKQAAAVCLKDLRSYGGNVVDEARG